MAEPLDYQPPPPDRPLLTPRQVRFAVVSGIVFILAAGAIYFLMSLDAGLKAFDRMAEMETRTYAPPMFATAAEATKACGIKVPAEAKNVWVETRSEWLEYEEFVRFEAPVSACLTHAADVVKGQPLLPVRASQNEVNMPPMSIGPRRSAPGWFDVRAATNVVGVGGGPREPQVWVDQTRGVYYYCVSSFGYQPFPGSIPTTRGE